jgi:drug/metabolite transporter (DMT)-like permease
MPFAGRVDRVDRLGVAALVVLGGLWGASFLFTRVAAPVLGVLPLTELRTAVGGLLLVPLLQRTGWRFIRNRWRSLLALGLLNAALPFTLIALATVGLGAGLAAVLNATTPLFTAVTAHVVLGDRLSRRATVGCLLGVAGVAALVGLNAAEPAGSAATVTAAAAASLAGAVSYAAGAVYARSRLAGAPLVALAAGQQLAAAVLLAPFAVAAAPRAGWTATAGAAAAGLAVLSTAVGYLLYFFLLDRLGPTRANSVTFLVPLFAVGWAATLLDEPVTTAAVGGGAAVLLGAYLVLRPARRPRQEGR